MKEYLLCQHGVTAVIGAILVGLVVLAPDLVCAIEATNDCPPISASGELICPAGTSLRVIPADAEAKALGVIQEELCWSARGDSTQHVKGFSLLRGAENVLLGYGKYRNGIRTGMWRTWNSMGSVHEQWLRRRRDAPDTLAIDFCACQPETAGEPWSFGSNGWRLSAAGPDSCRLLYSFEMEQGYDPERVYVVPRTLGLWGLHVKNGKYFFGALEPYFRGMVGVRSSGKPNYKR